MQTLKQLRNTLPQRGQITWLGARPARREPMQVSTALQLTTTAGIVGDRYAGRQKDRQVTFIQAEHLEIITDLIGTSTSATHAIDPAVLRRNVVVRGINLLALIDQTIAIGAARLRVTGRCHPCSRMEQVLGAGGYNAMRGHGGITAQVLTAGVIRIGDQLELDLAAL